MRNYFPKIQISNFKRIRDTPFLQLELRFQPEYTPLHLGGAEFDPKTYTRPVPQKGTPEKGKGKGKKGKGEPKEDLSIPQPIVLNLEISLKKD